MTRRVAVVLALALLAGCGKGRDDDAVPADTAVSKPAMPMDSGTAMAPGMSIDSGMMHSGMMADSVMMMDSAGGTRGGRTMTPARDADQMFLRMMSDHHEGLLRLAAPAMERGSTQAVKDDARTLHHKQEAERDSMVAMLNREYQEQHQPAAMHMHMMQADSLGAASGAAQDQMFYRMVIDHHREGLMMIDHMLPRMQKPGVRQMAEKMKADQTREIQEFQQKLNRG